MTYNNILILEDKIEKELKALDENNKGDFYYDNPGVAVVEIRFLSEKILELIKIIKKD